MSFNDDGEDAFICDNEKFEKLRIGRLRTDRETIQAKTYKNWINSVLIKARASIDDIYTDLADGQKLLLLLELITGEKIAEPSRGSSVLHKIENVSRCLKFIRSKDVYLESIGPEDIVNGNRRLTLGLIWTIILRFQLSQHLDFVQFDLKTIKDSLLLWCQSKTSKSTKCRVRDFKRSWSDGWAFVELVRSFRPDLIDPMAVSKFTSVQMLDKAFDVANQHLMIPSILDAEDVATSADENSILTYISYFYNLYCRNKTTGTGSKRIKFIITQLSEVQSVQNSYEAQVSELMMWIKERTAHFASEIDINEAHQQMSQFNDYFWNVRPEKLKARNDAESLYLDIVNMHKKRGLRPFLPKANLTVKDLEKAWQHLEEVERRRQSRLKEKMAKYEQLTKVMDVFDSKCLKLESYISEKMVLLNQIYEWKSTGSDDQNTDLSFLEVYLKQSELICCDIVSNSAKFDSIFKLSDQLIEHRYKNYEFVKMCCRHLKAKLKNLTDMASRNQRTIEATTTTVHYLKQLNCLKAELEQLTTSLTSLPHNRTNSVQNVFSNLEKCKQYESELRLLERQFLVVQSRLFLLTDNNNHQSTVLIEPTFYQQRLSLIRNSLEHCRQLLDQHITSNHQNLDYNEFSEEIEYLQMFFNEKTVMCQSSPNVCYDSTSIFSLQQRHNIIKLEVRTVEKQFFATCEKGYRLMAKENYYSPLVSESIEQTKLSLRRLMRLVNERTYLINDSIQLIRLVDQLGEMHRFKVEDIHQAVTSSLREADEMGRLELCELSELLQKINGLSVSAEHMEENHWATSTTGRSATTITITTTTTTSNDNDSSSSVPIHLVHLKEYSKSAVVVDHRHAFLLLRLEQSVHRLPHDIHCRLLRVVTDNFRAAQQLLTATAVDVDGNRLRQLLLLEQHTQADSVSTGNNNCHRDDDEEELRSLPSTCGHLNLHETERMVDLFLSGDNRLENFIGSLQERQAMFQSDMAGMNELMAFVRHTLQLLKVTQTFTRTFVQVKTDQQRHSRYFHQLRQSQAQSSVVPADDPSGDKTTSNTSTPPPQLTTPSPTEYQSKLNPEAFKFKVVTYKLQQNLNFIGNYLDTVKDDNATALAFKYNFSSDLIRKDLAQLSQLLTTKENLACLEHCQDAEKTAALIDSVVQNETLMGGKVLTLQRLEAVEDFFQTMADSIKQIGQVRPDADQITVRRHVRQMKTMTVTLQSHFEELINGASSLNEHRTVDYNDEKLYENRITNLKHQFNKLQKVIKQKSELCRQRLEQLTSGKIQISQMTAINQQTSETLDSSRVADQQFESVTNIKTSQELKERKSAPEQTQQDDLESHLSIAELVLFEMETAAGSVSQSKFAETMAICDNVLLQNSLTANDDTLVQRVDHLKTQLTRAWKNQVRQNELKQFNLLSAEFMTACKQRIELVKSLHYDSKELANCKQMVVQLQLEQRAIYEQFRLSKSEEIVSRLVQLQDALAKYEQIVNEKEIIAETMVQLNDITKRFDSIKQADDLEALESLIEEIDASINARNRTASLSNEYQLSLTQKLMELKKQIIEKQMKIKLSAVVNKMSCLTEQEQVNTCLILKSTFENLLESSEQLSVKDFNYDNKINELLSNWSLIKNKVDRILELIENTSVQSDVSMAATNLSSDPQNVILHFSLNNSSQNQSTRLRQESTNTENHCIQPIQPKSPNSAMEFPHPLTSSTTLTLPSPLESIQPISKSSDDHPTTTEAVSADLTFPDNELSTEFYSKASGRVGTRSSLESDFSADYLLSVKDFGSVQTSSEENFAHNLTESTLSLYNSESDSGHCELNYSINSPEGRGDHQTGVCTECQQPTDVNKHPPSSMGTSRQTISSSYASLPINTTEYPESSDEQKESESELSEEPEHLIITTLNDHKLERDCQTAQQMCTEMWTTVESSFEKINELVAKGNYFANQQTQQLLSDISFAITNRQIDEQEQFSNLNEDTQDNTDRVLNMLNSLSQSKRQLKYLVDYELQYLSDPLSKVEENEFTDDLFADELNNRSDGKAAPLAEQEDSWMPAEEINLTQNYVLSKSHPIDFTSTDFDCFARGDSSLSFASDIESNLQVDETIHPQLEGLEEKVDGLKSELEDIAARIAKHSDGKRLSFEIGSFDEMFEFKEPVSYTEKVFNKSDSIDGNKIENSSLLADNDNEILQNDNNSSEISISCQSETQLEDSDLQDVLQLCSSNALTNNKNESQIPDYSNKSDSSNNNDSNSDGGRHPTKQDEDFIVGDEKMTSVVDFDELNDDDSDKYLNTKQPSNDENENIEFTEKISFIKNDTTKADFPKISSNGADSTATANIETPNLFSPFVVNQKSTLSTNKIEKQQRKPIDDVQLDCLEDKVHQIAKQLDIIAEKLVEHVQMNAVDRSTSIASEKIHQKDVFQISENDSRLHDADSTDCLKNLHEISAIYDKSKIEIYQIHSTEVIPTKRQTDFPVLFSATDTKMTSVFKNEIDKTYDSETAKLPDDIAAKNTIFSFLQDNKTEALTTKDSLECSQTTTFEESDQSTSEMIIECLEQESTENAQNVVNFKAENASSSFNKVPDTISNSQETFNENTDTTFNKNNEIKFLHSTEEITSITNKNFDEISNQPITKSDRTVFNDDLNENLLPDNNLVSENKSSANLSDTANISLLNDNIHSENTNVLTSAISFQNNANQLPEELFTQNGEYSTVSQTVNSSFSTGVSEQTKSTKQTNECENSVWNINEKSMGSEHLNKLSNSVTADNQSTVDSSHQIELHLSTDDVQPFIEDQNVNRIAQNFQIESSTERLIFNLSDTSTSVSKDERNDFTEAEKLGHDNLHLNDDVNQTENIDARLGCLENKICNIASQLDSIAEQLVTSVLTSQTLDSNISLETIKHKIITSKSEFENDKSAESINENNQKELVNSANEMPRDELHITHESSTKTNEHLISTFENVLQQSELSAEFIKLNNDQESFEQIFEVPKNVSKENILSNQQKHEQSLQINKQLTTNSKIENDEKSTNFYQMPSPAGSIFSSKDVAEHENYPESISFLELSKLNEEQNYENQIELQIHHLPTDKVIENQNLLLHADQFAENAHSRSLPHLKTENDQLPELLTEENNNIVSSENNLLDNESNIKIISNETSKNVENQSYSNNLENTLHHDELSNLHNYSLSKSHLVNFKSLNTNLTKCNQTTNIEHQNDLITTNNDESTNEISHLPVVYQASSVTVPFPDDLQMKAESNANEAQPLPESVTQNDLFSENIMQSNGAFVIEQQADILHSNNLTTAKHINSEQQLPANCKVEETSTNDSHQDDLQNSKVIATSQKFRVPSIKKQSLTINSENELFEFIDETQIESLENRISIIAKKLDDIAENLINIAKSQTPSQSKTSKLNECSKSVFSEKSVSEKLKFEQQITLPTFIQSYHANSIDAYKISQQFKNSDLNEAGDCLTKYISASHSNSTTQPNSELRKRQTTTPLVQPELQTYASSTIKSGSTAAKSVEQPSLPTEHQFSSSNRQTKTRLQRNDESSMQESLVVSDKQTLNHFSVSNEDTYSGGQTDSNDSSTAQKQAGCSRSEIETFSDQITNEAHCSAHSKTVTTPESLLSAEHINEADMKDNADFIEQTTMETCYSNNLMTYADAVKLSKASCKVNLDEGNNHNASKLSIQTSSSQLSTDRLSNSPISSDNSEKFLIDMNSVTCDDDALLDYIETRVDVLDSKISNLTEWFSEYCNASRRPEQTEQFIWPKLDVLTIEPSSESFKQINPVQSIASRKSNCKEKHDSSVKQISGNSISENNSLSTDDRSVNKDAASQENSVYSSDLPANQENSLPAELLHRVHDASSTCNILANDKSDEKIDNELCPASYENPPLDTKIVPFTETCEFNPSELSTLTANELQQNALPPEFLSEKSNELEQSNSNHREAAKEGSLEIDLPKASKETEISVEKGAQTFIPSSELEQQSRLLHDTQVYDSSTSCSSTQNLILATLQTDKSSKTKQSELGTSASSMFDEQSEGEAPSSVSRKNCHTTAQDFEEDIEFRSVFNFDQPVLASVSQTDILPEIPLIENTAMECQQPKNTVSPESTTTEAVKNNLSETAETIPLIDLTSELSQDDDSLVFPFNNSAFKEVSVDQKVESKVGSFSSKSILNVTTETKQTNSSLTLDSERQFSSNAASISSTVAPTGDSKESVFESVPAYLPANKSANQTLNSEFCNQNSGASEESPFSRSPNLYLAGEDFADSGSVPLEDDDLVAAKCQLNDTDGGNDKDEQPLDVRQLSVGDTDTVGNLSTVPAIDRADIGQSVASILPQSAIPDTQLMQSKSSNTSSDKVMKEHSESQPRPPLPKEQPNRPPSGNFLSRNFGRMARYSLPCYLLPLLLLLILLIFPHGESDFNCLMQFDEYRSGIMKTYQDGPPPV